LTTRRKERNCEWCEGLMLTYRRDARYCSERCRTAAKNTRRRLVEYPDNGSQTGATLLKWESEGRRPSRDGTGTHIYYSAKDLDELATLTLTGSERIYRKTQEAVRRVKR